MKLSLVTGTLDRPESLQRLIKSIMQYTSVQWELVISDASEKSTASKYARMLNNIVVLEEKPRAGCTVGYNRAFRASSGEYCIWLNDECEVTEGYDTAAIEFMEMHPKIGLGALHYCEGDKPFHVNSSWGCTYANFGILRRSLGESVGWMDEEIRMYGCDNSLTFRVLLAGYGVSDIPGARIIHHSVKDDHRKENQFYRQRDNDTLTHKYIPLKPIWLANFQRNYVRTGTVPWVHGMQPRGVTVQ